MLRVQLQNISINKYIKLLDIINPDDEEILEEITDDITIQHLLDEYNTEYITDIIDGYKNFVKSSEFCFKCYMKCCSDHTPTDENILNVPLVMFFNRNTNILLPKNSISQISYRIRI